MLLLDTPSWAATGYSAADWAATHWPESAPPGMSVCLTKLSTLSRGTRQD